jgi:undecaprenyl-diphosphatase
MRSLDSLIQFLAGLDVRLMYFINQSLRCELLSWFMPVFDYDRNWVIPLCLILIIIMIFGGKRGRIAGLIAILIVILTDQISSTLIKPLVARIRPCNVLAGLNMWKDCKWIVIPNPVIDIYRSSYSFPSSHAINTGAQALWWSWVYPRSRWFAYSTAFVIGLSRIYDGMHYPLDVVGGWLMALGIIIIMISVISKTHYINILHHNT